MANITTFLIKGELDNYEDKVEFIKYNKDTILEDIKNAKGKYINFIKNFENIKETYFEKILSISETEFDVCFLNYTIEIDGKILSTEVLEEPEIQKKPYVGDYIWCYLWKKEKLIELLESNDKSNEYVDSLFYYVNFIREPIYNHKPSEQLVTDFIYTDEKKLEKRSNVFYLGNYINGQFNGYITWLKNIGRCFSNDYKMTIIYDKIYEPTRVALSKYFEMIERDKSTLYLCDKLFVTYSTYYYPKDLLVNGENYLFIHGNMSDYPHSRKYKYDNYTKYIGVSEISAKKAEGYFPTDHFEHIMNPIKIDPNDVLPHLKLVSAQRNDPIKKGERIHKISKILDEEGVPYTWNVFTDTNPYPPESVYGGVIYRRSVQNALPYINDADYFVQLSDSEACSYSVMEALSLNTKVILTPLDCYKEMKIDEDQGFIIPFEYFEDDNKEKLREVVLQIVKDQHKKSTNNLSPEMYKGYIDLLIK